jgi:putative transcriptional regulator
MSLCALGATPQQLPNIVREPAQGVFLVAKKSLSDPNFSRTVVLLTDHGFHGSIGLIVNKTSTVSVVSTLPELTGLEDAATKLHFGGPLQIRALTR